MDSYTINTVNGETSVTAHLAKGGLMVHRAHNGELLAPNEGPWRVTHIPSGYLVAKWGHNCKQACRCLEELLSVTDWSVDLDAILKVIGTIKVASKQVIKSHGMRAAATRR